MTKVIDLLPTLFNQVIAVKTLNLSYPIPRTP